MAARITDTEINRRLKEKRDNEYELNGPSTGIKNKTSVVHKVCGTTWDVIPHDVIRGVSTCPNCAVAKRRTISEAAKLVEEKTKGEYTIIGDYTGVKSKALIQHIPCGYTWHTIPHDIARGASRCLSCTPNRDSGFDKTKPAILYFLTFTVQSQPFFKIGITNRTIEERYAAEPYPIETVWSISFDKGITALELEKYFLKKYGSFKVNTKVLKDGNTETLSIFIPIEEVELKAKELLGE
jgi:hypothetical protein